ncbi:MAG: zf-HC2 domain-containing protein [Clostridiales bacterium]|nr:zf-HC2 domain-containing protein [Clostridiales bacterium]
MKTSFAVIRDLLSLYHDAVCSNESKTLVEKHLMGCDGCKAELKAMDDTLPIDATERNLKEAETFKNWNNGMRKSVLNGALFAIAAVIVILRYRL